MYSPTATIAAAALLAGGVSAYGNAIIKNQCSHDVYLWTTSNVPGQMQTISAGQSLTQSYLINPDGGGISMKLASEQDLSGPITQYEYTVAGTLWYDISNINGFPFMESGLTLVPSDSSCRSLVCPAGVELCTAAYNQPDDNSATASCGADADTTLVLCSDQQGNTVKAAVQAVVSNIAAVIAPSSSAAPVSSAAAAVANVNVAQPTTTAAVTTAAPSSSYVAPAVQAPTTSAVVVAAPSSAAPAPVTTAAPAQPADNDVVYFTTFVTKIYTVMADDFDNGIPSKREAQPEAAPEAVHVHKRADHRHHFQRHADAN